MILVAARMERDFKNEMKAIKLAYSRTWMANIGNGQKRTWKFIIQHLDEGLNHTIELANTSPCHMSHHSFLKNLCPNGWFMNYSHNVTGKKHQRRRQLAIMNIKGTTFFFLKYFLFSYVYVVCRLWSLLYYSSWSVNT